MGRKLKPENILKRDFTTLSGENRGKILDMTRFLVLAQEKIVPSMLNEGAMPANAPVPPYEKAGEPGLA